MKNMRGFTVSATIAITSVFTSAGLIVTTAPVKAEFFITEEPKLSGCMVFAYGKTKKEAVLVVEPDGNNMIAANNGCNVNYIAWRKNSTTLSYAGNKLCDFTVAYVDNIGAHLQRENCKANPARKTSTVSP